MADANISFCDETPVSVGWIAAEPARLDRASHALAANGGVWLVDPVFSREAEARARALGEPAGVLQLVDRHDRDCALFAERLGVQLYRVPHAGVPGSPFEVRVVLNVPGWREVMLWWPAERVLMCSEALGTASYFRAPGEALGVHPFLRLYQPRGLREVAASLAPAHVLVGHGEGIHGDAAAGAPAQAVRGARQATPRWLRHQLRRRRER
jgi:hypothetical protein